MTRAKITLHLQCKITRAKLQQIHTSYILYSNIYIYTYIYIYIYIYIYTYQAIADNNANIILAELAERKREDGIV